MENALSASDVALLNNGGEWGNNSFLWIFALLILANGGFGFGNNSRATDSAIADNEILSGQKFDTLGRMVNQVGDGLASLGYSQLQQMDSNTASINGNIVNEGRAIQSQLATCCCENQRNVDSVRFDMANYNASTNATITAQTQKILDKMAEDKIATLQAEVSDLKTASMFNGVPRINPYGYGIAPTFCGCGCNAI